MLDESFLSPLDSAESDFPWVDDGSLKRAKEKHGTRENYRLEIHQSHRIHDEKWPLPTRKLVLVRQKFLE